VFSYADKTPPSTITTALRITVINDIFACTRSDRERYGAYRAIVVLSYDTKFSGLSTTYVGNCPVPFGCFKIAVKVRSSDEPYILQTSILVAFVVSFVNSSSYYYALVAYSSISLRLDRTLVTSTPIVSFRVRPTSRFLDFTRFCKRVRSYPSQLSTRHSTVVLNSSIFCRRPTNRYRSHRSKWSIYKTPINRWSGI